jgi:hypothetical protein
MPVVLAIDLNPPTGGLTHPNQRPIDPRESASSLAHIAQDSADER